jgi:hypothetical protein
MPRILFVTNLFGQEWRKLGQLVQTRQAEPFKEVRGGAEQDRAGLVVSSSLFDESAQH